MLAIGLLGILASTLVSAPARQKTPDPYIGFTVGLFENKFAYVDEEGEDQVDRRRKKLLHIGLDFEISDLSTDDMPRLKAFAAPEIHFNQDMLLFNGVVGIEQDLPFGNYRAYPSGFFWGLAAGFHTGFQVDQKDYANESGKRISFAESVAIGVLGKFYFGPRFPINSKMDLKLRFFTDWFLGQTALFQSRSSFSNAVGSYLGFQFQIDFR